MLTVSKYCPSVVRLLRSNNCWIQVWKWWSKVYPVSRPCIISGATHRCTAVPSLAYG